MFSSWTVGRRLIAGYALAGLTLLEAGAVVLPAIPSFYSRPKSIVDLVDTVVWRVLDQIGLPNSRAYRWPDSKTSKN